MRNAKELSDAGFAFAEGEGTLLEGMKFFSNSPVFDDYGTLLSRFAKRLAMEAPQLGFDWLTKQDPSSLTCAALSKFAETLQKTNPALAANLSATVPSEVGREAFHSGVTRCLAAVSIDEAVKYINSIYFGNPVKLDRAAGGLIASIADNPNEVLRLSETFPRSISPEVYGEMIFKVWKTDKQSAEESLRKSNNEKFIDKIWGSFATKFVQDDYVGASEWAASLSPGNTRDAVSFTLAREISNNFPVDALRWSLDIQDAALRRTAVEMVIVSARHYDREGARKAINDSSLTMIERHQLLYRLDKLK